MDLGLRRDADRQRGGDMIYEAQCGHRQRRHTQRQKDGGVSTGRQAGHSAEHTEVATLLDYVFM